VIKFERVLSLKIKSVHFTGISGNFRIVLIWSGAQIVPNPQRPDNADRLRVGTTRAPSAICSSNQVTAAILAVSKFVGDEVTSRLGQHSLRRALLPNQVTAAISRGLTPWFRSV
jgi:hypothetical protein